MDFRSARTTRLPRPKERRHDPLARVHFELARDRSKASLRTAVIKHDPIAAQCMALLDADAFDAGAIKSLAGRESYPAAVEAFRQATLYKAGGQAGDLVKIL